MPEAELSLIFLRPLNQLGIRYIRSILNVSGQQINQADLDDWIRTQGVEKEWQKVHA